jgi:DNA primase large subunit
MNLKTASQYPFLDSVVKFTNETYEIDIDDFNKPEYQAYIDTAMDRIKSAIDYGEIRTEFNDYKDRLLSYPVAFQIILYVRNSWLSRRWAFAEADLVEKTLEKDTLERLLIIAREQFGWDIEEKDQEIDGMEYTLSIHMIDYMKGSLAFHEPKWKLPNRLLVAGYLPINQEELVKLLRVHIRDFLLGRALNKKSIFIPLQIELAALEIEAYVAENRPIMGDLPTDLEALPPCMNHIFNKLQLGINLSQTERFYLVAFLNRIGVKPSDIVEMFKVSPDFREDITKKQVGYITKDGKKDEEGNYLGYNAPACKKLKTDGLCKEDGTKMCTDAKHPLSSYGMRLWLINKKKEEAQEQ